MRNILPVFIFLIASISNCSSDKSPLQQLENKEPNSQLEFGTGNEYEIYSIVLNSFKRDYPPIFVLSDSTIFWDISNSIHYFKDNMPSLLDDTIDDYQNINKESIQLKNIPDLEVECFLIPKNEAVNWKIKHPDAVALIHFSRVGFNAEKNQALVYFTDYFAPLAGSGNLILLEKNMEWVIVKTVMVWIS